jgi:tRNA uridine 5-carbamoylmethylation protein Kti12
MVDNYFQTITERNQKMETKKIPIKIVISGNRACGKSVMAQFLADMFEQLGADVIHRDSDLDRKMFGKQQKEYYRSVKKRFDKQVITIKVKDVVCTEKNYEKQFNYAQKYIKKWGETK